ncbi:hypothetical protein BDW60DRAFT_109747 [Aspergillus nidulans var. acristatus]
MLKNYRYWPFEFLYVLASVANSVANQSNRDPSMSRGSVRSSAWLYFSWANGIYCGVFSYPHAISNI